MLVKQKIEDWIYQARQLDEACDTLRRRGRFRRGRPRIVARVREEHMVAELEDYAKVVHPDIDVIVVKSS